MRQQLNLELLRGLRGLEIAGPSGIFGEENLFPVYSYVESLDDFSHPRPLDWGGRPLVAGGEFRYAAGRPTGRQFVGDATSLKGIDDATYDVIIGSHVLEHIANPLKALRSWLSALKPDGLLLQVIPHGEGTFDRNRPVTPLAHLIDDFDQDVPEDDRTHYAEVAALSTQNHSEHWFAEAHLHRGVHQHVFDTASVLGLYRYVGLAIVGVAAVKPHHIAILGRKGQARADEALSEHDIDRILMESPFNRDRAQARAVPAKVTAECGSA